MLQRRADGRRADLSAQSVGAGVSAAGLGYAGSVALLVAGLTAVGATPGQVSSALVALGLLMATTSVALSAGLRLPVAITWSTPGSALLIVVGAGQDVTGGFSAVVGALLATSALIVLTGLVRPVGRVLLRLPSALTAAVLAGVLLPFCLDSVSAIAALPPQCVPIAVTWLVVQRRAPAWSAPAALLALAAVALLAGDLGAVGHQISAGPALELVRPRFTLDALARIAVPFYLVTMAGQNLVGAAVLAAEGYRPPVGTLLVVTGAASAAGAPFGATPLCLAAITGTLTAGPGAHPDQRRRWVAGAVSGLTYLLLAALAPVATALVTGTDPRLVATAAGLALMRPLAASLTAAMRDETTRLPAILTLAVTGSGITGAPAAGLVVGLLVLGLNRQLDRSPRSSIRAAGQDLERSR